MAITHCSDRDHSLFGLVTVPIMFAMTVNAGCADHPLELPLESLERSRLIDLTHAFGNDTIVWPTEQNVKIISQHAEDMPGGYYYASNRLELPEHGGTHIDAPIHFAKGKQTLDHIPIDRMVGSAVRIDVSEQCANDRDYRVLTQDLERWESRHGRIPPRTIVLLDTGFGRLWPSRREYLGTELRGAEGVQALRFPGLHPDAATWLVHERGIKAVGIDTASIDYGRSATFEAHVALLSQNVPVFENLADLSGLPDRGFNVVALPMKIAGGTRGPLRIIAVVPNPR